MFFQDVPPPPPKAIMAVFVGILSPECEKQREIEAIKNDPCLIHYLGNQVIQDIVQVREESGLFYLVKTDLCEMRVDVRYLPPLDPQVIGAPQRFELEFHEPVYYSN
jgi:hypothetical protein